MAQLIMGSIGAAFGSAFGPVGAQIGWLAGSYIGGAFFGPARQVEGPRLNDLKLQTSTYGRMLPIVFGTMRIAGNVIDQSDLRETRTETRTGKGGGGVTQVQYTYSADFAVEICAGPIVGVRKIWADGKLIYDLSSLNTESAKLSTYMTLYLGDELQLPDPTLEALHGVNNVPGYRGRAYVVFTDLPLTDYGNRLPSLEFEVVTGGTPTYVRALGSTDGSFLTNTVRWNGDSYTIWNTTTVQLVDGTPAIRIDYHLYGLDGSHKTWYELYPLPVTTQWTFPEPVGWGAGLARNRPTFYVGGPSWSHYSPPQWYPATTTGPAITVLWAAISPTTATSGRRFVVDYRQDTNKSAYMQQYDNDPSISGYWLSRFVFQSSTEDGTTTISTKLGAAPVASIHITDLSTDFYVTIDEITGYVYISDGHLIRRLDPDTLKTLVTWTSPTGNNGFQVYANLFATQSINNPQRELEVYRLNDDGTTTFLQAIPFWTTDPTIPFPADMGTLIGGSGVGTYVYQIGETLPQNTVPLSQAVTDICGLAGLSPSDIDVTALTDTLNGFVITNITSARAALEQLSTAFFFDAYEADGKIHFVKRNGASVKTITMDNLIQAEEPLRVVRTKETDLPRQINVEFYNPDQDFQIGTQLAQRHVTSTAQVETLQLPISLHDIEASKIADVSLYEKWTARTSYEFSLPMSYLQLTPCDILTLSMKDGNVLAQLRKVVIREGFVDCTATETDSGVLTPTVTAQVVTGGQTVEPTSLDTKWEYMDIPPLRDKDGDSARSYVAGNANWGFSSNWPGALIYKSVDGGISWNNITAIPIGATMGVVQNALPSSNWGMVDESNFITVALRGGTLTSCTNAQLLAGTNVALIGSEIVGFRDVTYDLATDTYTLRGLLRGMRGTEYAMSTHFGSDRFVLLVEDGSVQWVDEPLGELNIPALYKAVTIGSDITTASDMKGLTPVGNALLPLAPINVAGRKKDNDVTITATRRDRKGQGCFSYMDAPLSENPLVFDIDVHKYDGTIVRSITDTALPYTYSSANQVTDFGFAPAVNFQVDVYQKSPSLGRGHVASSVILPPTVTGPYDFENGVVPGSFILSSANGSLSVVDDTGSKRLRLDLVVAGMPRVRVSQTVFKNGSIQVDAPAHIQTILWARTNNWANESYSLGWYAIINGGMIYLYRGADGSGGAGQVALSAPGISGWRTIKFVFVHNHFEVWEGPIGGILTRYISVDDTNLNQAGYAGIAASYFTPHYMLFDNLRIEQWV